MVRYIYYRIGDGIGFQYYVLTQLYHIARHCNIPILFDLRHLPYFTNWSLSVPRTMFKDIFHFDNELVITDFDVIDNILRDSAKHPIDQLYICDVTPSNSCEQKQPGTLVAGPVLVGDASPVLRTEDADQIKRVNCLMEQVRDNARADIGCTQDAREYIDKAPGLYALYRMAIYLSNQGVIFNDLVGGELEMKLLGKSKQRFDACKGGVAKCVGIHARLGNGEGQGRVRNTKNEYNGKPRRTLSNKIQESNRRMTIKYEKYFHQMDVFSTDTKFFVCTDTKDFLDKCVERYNEQIISVDRYWLDPGDGPGHSFFWRRTNRKDKTNSIFKRNKYGADNILSDALVDMFLLGECKHLIYNVSAFTHHARHFKNVPRVEVSGIDLQR